MNEETVLPTAASDSGPAEPSAVADESLPAETVPTTEPPAVTDAPTEPSEEPTVETTVATTPEPTVETTVVTEPEETEEYFETLEPEETMEVTETTEVVVELEPYIPAIAEATSVVANIILCGALMIVGALCGIRLWR